ncbi:MAG: tRNA uracil 4-sulfurtransferase ThiI [Bacillus sp. (in: firmicutes)]
MKYDQIMIRFGELSTKGKNRRDFVVKLKRSVKNATREFDGLEIQSTRDRMYINLNGVDYQPVSEKLVKVFGIQSFSPVMNVEKDIDSMKEAALHYVNGLSREISTFKVTTKRADKTFPMETNEINHAIGGHVLWHNQGLKVDVKNPDLNLIVEIRKEAAFLTGEVIQGAGGMPLNSNGKAMLMLSGGIDSPVAGFMAMKRGVEIECVHFYSPPFTSERSKQKVLDLAEVLAETAGHMVVHIVPFTEIQKKIQQQIPENYSMTTTRRMMLKIADRITHKRGGLAIITGESLGQVASQTLHSMYAINEVTTTPVLRPLITADKNEIISMAQELGTLDISNRPYEDCCTVFTPANPKTMPRREKVNHYEGFSDFEELIAEAVEKTEEVHISPKRKEAKKMEEDLF